jgi:hypothetical protein
MSFDVVNGYICHNCTDVDYAKRNIDPAHPHDGPFGVNKDQQPGHGPAVVLGGALAKSDPTSASQGTHGVAAVNGVESAGRSQPSGPPDDRAGGRISITV